MRDDELAETKRQLANFQNRLELMRAGKLTTLMGTPCDIDTTRMSIEQAEQSVAALERKIARLEAGGA